MPEAHLRIFWSNVISNEDLRERTRVTIMMELRTQKRRSRWLGNRYFMPSNSLPISALRCRGDRGRPKDTWRRNLKNAEDSVLVDTPTPSSCRQSQVEDPCHRLKHQTTQRGLCESRTLGLIWCIWRWTSSHVTAETYAPLPVEEGTFQAWRAIMGGGLHIPFWLNI